MKIAKTLHPTPHTPHPAPTEKLFAANPDYVPRWLSWLVKEKSRLIR